MFDVLEARFNRAAMKKLSNATAVIGDVPHPVIFDAEFKLGSVGTVGIGASEPMMTISSDVLPEEFIGTAITVNGAAWTVGDRQADGAPAGLTVVMLEKA